MNNLKDYHTKLAPYQNFKRVYQLCVLEKGSNKQGTSNAKDRMQIA